MKKLELPDWTNLDTVPGNLTADLIDALDAWFKREVEPREAIRAGVAPTRPTLMRLREAVAGALDPDLALIAADALNVEQLMLLLKVQEQKPILMSELLDELDRDSASVGPAGEEGPND